MKWCFLAASQDCWSGKGGNPNFITLSLLRNVEIKGAILEQNHNSSLFITEVRLPIHTVWENSLTLMQPIVNFYDLNQMEGGSSFSFLEITLVHIFFPFKCLTHIFFPVKKDQLEIDPPFCGNLSLNYSCVISEGSEGFPKCLQMLILAMAF